MEKTMKDSGVKWIGDIPQSWKVNKIKYIANLKGRIGWQGLTSDEYQDEGAYLITGTDFREGGINWDTCVHVPMKRWEEATEIQIENGDLLITKDGTVGKIALVNDIPGKTSLNSGVLRIITDTKYSRRFLFWTLQSDVFWNWFNYKNAGNSTIVHLYQADFEDFVYTFPCLNEQELIADYLDKKCTEIDNVISKIERQIEKLNDYKKSLIQECVTKGLNKQSKLKQTNISIIGEVPVHWDYKRLKYLLKTPLQYGANEVGDDFDDINPRYIRITDITEDGKLKEDGRQSLQMKLAKPYLLNDGNVLFARSGATVGKTFFYTKECGIAAFAGYLIKADVNEKVLNPKFLYYITLGNGYENWKNSIFSQATIQNIGADKYADLPIPVPPIDEQLEIIEYLDTKISKLENITSSKKQQLEDIRQCKSSLIYEYVTGKKRIKVGE